MVPFLRLPLQSPEPEHAEGGMPSPLALSFIALVLVPIMLAAVYLFTIAADQYVSEFRFSLNSIDPLLQVALFLLIGDRWQLRLQRFGERDFLRLLLFGLR